MKTIEQIAEQLADQLAEEYADERVKVVVPDAEITYTVEDLNMFAQVDFIAGYEAAQQWFSVQDEPIPLDALCIAVAEKGGRINCNFKTISDRDNACKLYGLSHYLPIPKLPTK